MAGLTQKEIASRLGVSAGLVSCVLKDPGTPRASDETKNRIFEFMSDRGLRANNRQIVSIAYVVADRVRMGTEVQHHLMLETQQAAADRSYFLMLTTWERHRAEILRNGGIKGLVVSMPIAQETICEVARCLPTVSLHYTAPGDICDSVVGNDRQGIRLAVEHLVARGRRHVAYLGYSDPRNTSGFLGEHHLVRYRAFSEACEELGIAVPEEHFGWTGESAANPGRGTELSEIVDSWLAAGKVPDAVLCFNDQLAAWLYPALKARGLRIPADIAVVGFDDCDWASFMQPKLTTIRPDYKQMAASAVSMLCERINNTEDNNGSPRQVVCECKLVVRESA